MILITCLDEQLGMAFNRRRQSRDRALIADICAQISGAPIWMDSRSAALFNESEANICCNEAFVEKAGKGEYCFMEFASPSSVASEIEKLIIYRWNRRYQADIYFDIDLGSWQLESTSEFPGTSHEKITKEVYTRE